MVFLFVKEKYQKKKEFFYIKEKKRLGIVAHACDPSPWEAEAGGLL